MGGPGGLTEFVARSVVDLKIESVPSDILEIIKQCILDWIGVALAGSQESAAVILRDEILAQGTSGSCSVIGADVTVSARDAALINGVSGHCLDFDDVVGVMSGHPTAPLLPALIALGEHIGATGAQLVEAYLAGFEAECRIAMAVLPSHYDRGFHATGTIGSFGAAAGCARLLGLDLAQVEIALGIAGTQASGLKSMFGTMCKPFHAGHAAECGLMAATLAQRGFTSIPDVLEVDQGFADTQATSFDPCSALIPFGDPYFVRSVLFKFHAACFFTHATIEAIIRLKESAGFVAEDVKSIRLQVPEQHMRSCNIVTPVTPLEAKFSLRFTAALALTRGQLTEKFFCQDTISDPQICKYRDLAEVEPVSNMSLHSGRVVLELTNGRSLALTVDMDEPAVGARAVALQLERLEAKFVSLAAPVIGENRVESVVASVANITEIESLHELTGLFH